MNNNVRRMDIESIRHEKYVDKKIENMKLTYNDYEQKMMAKGYRYTEVLGEIVPTWTFASPERQLQIAAMNKLYLERKHKPISK